jgi:hypothetical protein
MSDKSASSREDNAHLAQSLIPDFDLDRVRQAVRGIRFGEVRIIIQDGLIVQIERVEKQRLR